MDIRAISGQAVRPLPRQEQQERLARWKAGAREVAKPAQPPEAQPSGRPQPEREPPPADPFPFLHVPFGGFQETDPAQALKRERQPAAEARPNEPFRAPSDLPDEAAAKEISRALALAIDRDPVKAQTQVQAERRAERAAAKAAEAHRMLQEHHNAQLHARVTRLGSLMAMVVGRYGTPPSADSERIDTRQ